VILDELLDARLNGEVRSRQDEWAYLKSLHPELFKDVPEEFPAAAAASEAQGRSAI
jgi:hypothetical protein